MNLNALDVRDIYISMLNEYDTLYDTLNLNSPDVRAIYTCVVVYTCVFIEHNLINQLRNSFDFLQRKF